MAPERLESITLQFGLVSFPAIVYSARDDSHAVTFHPLHKKDGRRLENRLTLDGHVVDPSNVMLGYEFELGKYVHLTPEEMDRLPFGWGLVELTEFIPQGKVDRIFVKHSHFLAPDKGGDRAYHLLREALGSTGLVALGRYALAHNQNLILVRPWQQGLIMETLCYAKEVHSIKDIPLGEATVDQAQLKLARQLIQQQTNNDFRPEAYRDTVEGRIIELIERKIETGVEIQAEDENLPSEATIQDLMNALKASAPSKTQSGSLTPEKRDGISTRKATVEAKLEGLFEELDRLVGLAPVKKEVRSLANFVRLQGVRKAAGLSPLQKSYHLIFTGNPGTGKTTVARIVANIFGAVGFLPKGHLVETDRADLVVGYIGQTATKTQEVVRKALGGVLFIDEAYSLTERTHHEDLGIEAVTTLLKMMEDHRDNLVVIAAGYPDLMAAFLKSNPGLQSRFTRTIAFPDYNLEELVTIFYGMIQHDGLRMTAVAKWRLRNLLAAHYEHRDNTFGNARLVRTLVESTIARQADRLADIPEPSKSDLTTIEADDVSDPPPGESLYQG